MLASTRLAIKLPAAFLALTVSSVLLVAIISYMFLRNDLRIQADFALTNAANQRTADAHETLSGVESLLELLSRDVAVSSFVNSMTGAFIVVDETQSDPTTYLRKLFVDGNSNAPAQRYLLAEGADDLTPYSALHAGWQDWVTRLVQHVGARDLYVADLDGNIVYSWNKGSEFAQSINGGALPQSALTAQLNRALTSDGVSFTSFEVYSGLNEHISFGSVPVFDNEGAKIGAIAIAFPISMLNGALGKPMGMHYSVHTILVSKNGEALVGHDDDVAGGHSDEDVMGGISNSELAQAALAASTVVEIDRTRFDGLEMVTTYRSVELAGQKYGLIVEAEKQQVFAKAGQLRLVMGGIVLAVLALSALVGLWVARSIVRPLDKMRETLDTMAQNKDLSARFNVESNDEVGASARAVGAIVEVMDQTLISFRRETVGVSGVAQELSHLAQGLAANAEIQAEAVEELSAAAEETNQQVQSGSAAAKDMGRLASATYSVAQEGKEKVTRMVSAMSDISQSSEEIGKTIKVIDEIAFQTNLLALNAAVEAARAGTHGRGFSVVAQEVRNLAARSAKAAQETRSLIEKSANQVRLGVDVSNDTFTAFDNIANDVGKVVTLIQDIVQSVDEQAKSVTHMNTAISSVAQIARDSTSQADLIAQTAENLTGTNASLLKHLGQFRLSGGIPDQPVTMSTSDLRKGRGSSSAPSNLSTRPARSVMNIDHDERSFGSF